MWSFNKKREYFPSKKFELKTCAKISEKAPKISQRQLQRKVALHPRTQSDMEGDCPKAKTPEPHTSTCLKSNPGVPSWDEAWKWYLKGNCKRQDEERSHTRCALVSKGWSSGGIRRWGRRAGRSAPPVRRRCCRCRRRWSAPSTRVPARCPGTRSPARRASSGRRSRSTAAHKERRKDGSCVVQ
jgi:hypothetical protein